MRVSQTNNTLTVNAIAGTHVVTMGFNLSQQDCDGLLGFSIHRQSLSENEAYYMKGMKCFEETDPKLASGSMYETSKHPWQSFQYADYSAKENTEYTYTITALKGTPKNLVSFAQVVLEITTERAHDELVEVYFNRGTAGSQEFVRRFGDKDPRDEDIKDVAFTWLSRGLYEALCEYVSSCEPGVHSLRIAAYEFKYEPFIKLIKETIQRGVTVEVVYDYRKEDGPKYKNEALVNDKQLQEYCTQRSNGKSYISHNKFIIKLENNVPKSVLTGGTNFSENGIFGQSNVAQVIHDESISREFNQYWELLQKNETVKNTRVEIEDFNQIPNIQLPLTSCIFSPRKSLDALEFYKTLAMTAEQGLFMTFAFGINDLFKTVYEESNTPLRFALLEAPTRPLKKGSVELQQELDAIKALRKKPENIFSIGDFVQTNKFDGWVKEIANQLSNNVQYIHNKFMLIDPLGSNPIVINGSANFSDASTTDNDENMVLMKGNKRVADIFFGEYMRLFSHFSFRESLKWRKKGEKPKFLKTNKDEIKWWDDYFKNTHRKNFREFFSNMEV